MRYYTRYYIIFFDADADYEETCAATIFLMLAVFYNNVPLVTMLLDHGADPHLSENLCAETGEYFSIDAAEDEMYGSWREGQVNLNEIAARTTMMLLLR
jgi:hypothetical protein